MKIRSHRKNDDMILKSSGKSLHFKSDTIGEEVIVQAFAINMSKDNALRKKKKAPIAKYDVDSKKAYLEYPDGRRVYSD